MRRMIIILSILLVAGVANAQFPVNFICASNDAQPAEGEFCRVIKLQFAATGSVVYEFDPKKPHFKIIVLPTARDGYTSVTVASNFIYPPLSGLALSAFLSSYLLIPCDEEQLLGAAGYIAQQNIDGLSKWMVWFDKKTHPNRASTGVVEAK